MRTLEWAQTPIQPGDTLSSRQQAISERILKEIHARLGFLVDVGLDYLTLQRSAASLSGGEAQRIRLATQIGSRLMGVLYVLDEPSIGLHPRDNGRLLKTLMGCATWAIPCWWWSMMKRPSVQRIGSWTWDPGRRARRGGGGRRARWMTF